MIEEVQRKIGYRFKDVTLLEAALTHSSYANESGLPFCNERLEFLGDAVLELVVSEALYRTERRADEGELTSRRSFIVAGESLAAWVRENGIDSAVRTGKSMGRKTTESVEGDAAEAIFGAVFIDGGYEAAKKVIQSLIESRECEPEDLDNPKSKLQEWMQSSGGGVPHYRTTERRGPDHERLFKAEVLIDGEPVASAWGTSVKEAEQKAAQSALEKAGLKD